jgi:hypothetical protein
VVSVIPQGYAGLVIYMADETPEVALVVRDMSAALLLIAGALLVMSWRAGFAAFLLVSILALPERFVGPVEPFMVRRPNMHVQRTRSSPLRSPLTRRPLGRLGYVEAQPADASDEAGPPLWAETASANTCDVGWTSRSCAGALVVTWRYGKHPFSARRPW